MSLEREIENLFAIDHAPEFVAKVRVVIAAEPAPRVSWLSWQLVSLGTGLTALAVAALLWPAAAPEGIKGISPTLPSSDAVVGPGAVLVAPNTAAGVPKPVALRRRPKTHRGSPGSMVEREASVEIVLSPDDARAFRLLVTAARKGALPELPPSDAGSAAAGPPWIEITPVVISPIAQLAHAEGERQ